MIEEGLEFQLVKMLSWTMFVKTMSLKWETRSFKLIWLFFLLVLEYDVILSLGLLIDSGLNTWYIRFFSYNRVSLKSKKQMIAAKSNVETEYRAGAHTSCELT